MNPDALIETYVGDVVRHLPRSQRNDVAFELRSLLAEELQGRSADSGREPDAWLATQLLTEFGRPVDVADRYRPAGFTVIRPSEAPRFARIALGGVVLQWILTLVATFSTPSELEWPSLLGAWWLSWGLGSFWWPGFLVTLSLIAGFVQSRREAAGEWMLTRGVVRDRDHVRRPLIVLYIALGVVGASIVTSVPSIALWGAGLPGPVVEAFALEGEFVSTRAPWVLVLWAVTLAVGIAVLVAGRWTPITRRISAALSIAWLALLLWWVAAGPIFTQQYADEVTKICLVLVAVIVAVDAVVAFQRGRAAVIHSPVA